MLVGWLAGWALEVEIEGYVKRKEGSGGKERERERGR